mmetsp:Transcript_4247/g.7713  ORF Transcript_4247/g.7713 Transcript_4247/m.7713 type:complete len:97 (-) Transcript_4247:33-323(-)
MNRLIITMCLEVYRSSKLTRKGTQAHSQDSFQQLQTWGKVSTVALAKGVRHGIIQLWALLVIIDTSPVTGVRFKRLREGSSFAVAWAMSANHMRGG